MRKFVVFAAVLFVSIAFTGCSSEEQQNNMITRAYPILYPENALPVPAYDDGSFVELKGESPSESQKKPRNMSKELKEFFAGVGVKWPEGSSLSYSYKLGKIFVKNTQENIELFEEVFYWSGFAHKQIEVEVQFVEFKLTDIEPLAIKNDITKESLLDLWKNKKGILLAAPKVIAQNGAEATTKGVKEVIYPTELKAVYPEIHDNTNTTITINEMIFAPCGFETREVGALLSVLPELSSEKNFISLTLSPELCQETEWKSYKAEFEDAKGIRKEVSIDQPFFHTLNVALQIMLEPGAISLIGGGMPSKNEGKVVYAFVTARLLNTKGEIIEKPTD